MRFLNFSKRTSLHQLEKNIDLLIGGFLLDQRDLEQPYISIHSILLPGIHLSRDIKDGYSFIQMFQNLSSRRKSMSFLDKMMMLSNTSPTYFPSLFVRKEERILVDIFPIIFKSIILSHQNLK